MTDEKLTTLELVRTTALYVLKIIEEKGLVRTDAKSLLERVLDPNINPYLLESVLTVGLDDAVSMLEYSGRNISRSYDKTSPGLMSKLTRMDLVDSALKCGYVHTNSPESTGLITICGTSEVSDLAMTIVKLCDRYGVMVDNFEAKVMYIDDLSLTKNYKYSMAMMRYRGRYGVEHSLGSFDFLLDIMGYVDM